MGYSKCQNGKTQVQLSTQPQVTAWCWTNHCVSPWATSQVLWETMCAFLNSLEEGCGLKNAIIVMKGCGYSASHVKPLLKGIPGQLDYLICTFFSVVHFYMETYWAQMCKCLYLWLTVVLHCESKSALCTFSWILSFLLLWHIPGLRFTLMADTHPFQSPHSTPIKEPNLKYLKSAIIKTSVKKFQ